MTPASSAPIVLVSPAMAVGSGYYRPLVDEFDHPVADGVVSVGGAVPWFRHFAYGGIPIAVLAGVVVPTTTAQPGYLPKPAFGGPGARTFMREWARMVLTGRPPFRVEKPIGTRALIVSLGHDSLSPKRAVDRLARLFAPESVTRWHYATDQVAAGESNDHVGWVRTRGPSSTARSRGGRPNANPCPKRLRPHRAVPHAGRRTDARPGGRVPGATDRAAGTHGPMRRSGERCALVANEAPPAVGETPQ